MKDFFLFSTFISTKVIRVIFVVGAIFLFVMVGWLLDDAGIIVGLPSAIVAIIIWRLILEMNVAIIRIAENTTKLVETKELE
jgi:uncharacterized membrane protein